ncbi:MAG: type III secretion system translocon subunit SctB [Kiritimatiellae bacterium]|nr:type III secretion system translocon subunit SctB [Kiritimatiellia bacterium]
MSIIVNPGTTSVNWESLLSELGSVEKTTGTDGKELFKVTMTVDGAEKTYTFGIPDDLDKPGTVDQAAINTLCDKLLADKDLFNLSEEDIKTLRSNLTAALEVINSNGMGNAASKTVMFDIYKLMALLVEVAQKQRDASRELRLAENMQIQMSILQQASEQRTAALTSLLSSIACCVLQVGVSIGMMIKQNTAFKQQADTMKTTGVTEAKAQLAEHTQQLKKLESDEPVLKEGTNDPLTAEERTAKIAEVKDAIKADKIKLHTARTERLSDETYLSSDRTIKKFDAMLNIVASVGQVAQSLVQNTNALLQAGITEEGARQQKAQEDLDQTKDLFSQAQELVNQIIKVMQAVIAAENQSMRDSIQV